jgi:hypothetical protein
MDETMRQLRAAGVDIDALRDGLTSLAVPPSNVTMGATDTSLVRDPLALTAALRGTFIPSDLGVPIGSEVPSSDLDALLAQSEVVTFGSERAWQLKPEARRSILLSAQRQDLLQSAAQALDAESDPRDREGRLLRRALEGAVPDVERLSIEQLDQLATIAQWVGGTELAQLPSEEDLRRIIRQRELLDPFRQLVGRAVGDGADGTQDRVIGRDAEIERLRAHVGIVPPDQLSQLLSRGCQVFGRR